MMLNKIDRGKKVVKKRANFQLLFFNIGEVEVLKLQKPTEMEPLENKSQQRIFISAAMMAGKRKNRYIKDNLHRRFVVGLISDKQDEKIL